jgi:bifunctional non-homologous end joining protein LigD
VQLSAIGRADTGMPVRELARVAARLKPLATDRMPIDVPPPRTSRFGSPLVLSRVEWVQPELVAEVTYLEWTDHGLLRQVVYQGCGRTNRHRRSGVLRRGTR